MLLIYILRTLHSPYYDYYFGYQLFILEQTSLYNKFENIIDWKIFCKYDLHYKINNKLINDIIIQLTQNNLFFPIRAYFDLDSRCMMIYWMEFLSSLPYNYYTELLPEKIKLNPNIGLDADVIKRLEAERVKAIYYRNKIKNEISIIQIIDDFIIRF